MTSALRLCDIMCTFSERRSGLHGVNTSAQEKGKQDDMNVSESGQQPKLGEEYIGVQSTINSALVCLKIFIIN